MVPRRFGGVVFHATMFWRRNVLAPTRFDADGMAPTVLRRSVTAPTRFGSGSFLRQDFLELGRFGARIFRRQDVLDTFN